MSQPSPQGPLWWDLQFSIRHRGLGSRCYVSGLIDCVTMGKWETKPCVFLAGVVMGNSRFRSMISRFEMNFVNWKSGWRNLWSMLQIHLSFSCYFWSSFRLIKIEWCCFLNAGWIIYLFFVLLCNCTHFVYIKILIIFNLSPYHCNMK